MPAGFSESFSGELTPRLRNIAFRRAPSSCWRRKAVFVFLCTSAVVTPRTILCKYRRPGWPFKKAGGDRGEEGNDGGELGPSCLRWETGDGSLHRRNVASMVSINRFHQLLVPLIDISCNGTWERWRKGVFRWDRSIYQGNLVYPIMARSMLHSAFAFKPQSRSLHRPSLLQPTI